MTIKTGQRLYRVRGPDGLWARKGEYPNLVWEQKEEKGTFWKKLSHLKSSMKNGVFQGLPPGAYQVYEYEAQISRTGRKHRLSELEGFYDQKQDDGAAGDEREVRGGAGADAPEPPGS